MAHIIPFRLPDSSKTPRRQGPAADAPPATVTQLALKRQPPARAEHD